jgi:hypothetical protein
MKNLRLLLILLLFNSIGCSKDNVIIEKFVWIRHNQNWIHDPKDLKAKVYLEYIDSDKKLNMAYIKTSSILSSYYSRTAPDSLKNLIIRNLNRKKYPECFENKSTFPRTYDRDFYCIIYKLSNDNEHILNYNPYTIPDSLASLTDYLENLTKTESYELRDSFDVSNLLAKYRDKIIPCSPLAPSPAPEGNRGKYVPPIIVDSIPK